MDDAPGLGFCLAQTRIGLGLVARPIPATLLEAPAGLGGRLGSIGEYPVPPGMAVPRRFAR